eukprot:3800054-Lingulodinium_polyedra.AAC.1
MQGCATDEEGRLQFLAAHAGGRRALHVVLVYGHAEGARAAEANVRLVMEAVAWLRSLGEVPAL